MYQRSSLRLHYYVLLLIAHIDTFSIHTNKLGKRHGNLLLLIEALNSV